MPNITVYITDEQKEYLENFKISPSKLFQKAIEKEKKKKVKTILKKLQK